jgi:TonB family protein
MQGHRYRECSEIVGCLLLNANGEYGRMNVRIAAVSVILLCLAGCGGTQEVAVPTERLELVSMTPLPPISLRSCGTGMRVIVLMHILQDGTVEDMKMLGSSGDSEWDSLALQAMRQWRYDPPRRNGVSVDVWIRQPLVIRIQEPIVMTIGELVSASLREADSLCSLLGKAVDLDPLFKQTMSTVDIVTYPPNVKDHLKRLGRGENTGPLRVGDKYVIYKRF